MVYPACTTNFTDNDIFHATEQFLPCGIEFSIIHKLTTLTSNLNASKYLKNEKGVFFSENPYVLYTKDTIFPKQPSVYLY